MSNTEKILEVISKLEKQKNVLLDKREQLQFHARIATKQKADLATQIREVTSFKAEKEPERPESHGGSPRLRPGLVVA